MTKPSLSKRQQEVFHVIAQAVRQHGYPPSVREIGDALGLTSSATVHAHLTALERKGYIRRDPAKPRALEITDGSAARGVDHKMIEVPVVGIVAAGQPILAEEMAGDYLPVSTSLCGGATDVFFLTVQGNSMIDAGIFDGDLVLIRRQETAQNGEIVVAMVESVEGPSTTLKRFYKENDHIRLQPENSGMEPIFVKDCKIIGKMIALVRQCH